jgi:putative transposase
MGAGRLSVLQVGDWVHIEGADHQVVALTGTAVRLRSATGAASVMLASYLLASPDFALVEGAPMPTVEPFGLLDGLPPEVVDRARECERHLVEVITGFPPGAAPGVSPRPGYEPQHTTVQRRDDVKAAELTAAGEPVSTRTVRRLRLRYTEQGLWGLVDQRATRTDNQLGRADPRLVAAIRTELDAQTHASTGTRTWVIRRVTKRFEAEHGPGVVPVPSRSTFYELLAALSTGRHSFGAATSRRSLANRPDGPFTPTFAIRPGEIVQTDSTPLDVMVILDSGVLGRPRTDPASRHWSAPSATRSAQSPRTASA